MADELARSCMSVVLAARNFRSTEYLGCAECLPVMRRGHLTPAVARIIGYSSRDGHLKRLSSCKFAQQTLSSWASTARPGDLIVQASSAGVPSVCARCRDGLAGMTVAAFRREKWISSASRQVLDARFDQRAGALLVHAGGDQLFGGAAAASAARARISFIAAASAWAILSCAAWARRSIWAFRLARLSSAKRSASARRFGDDALGFRFGAASRLADSRRAGRRLPRAGAWLRSVRRRSRRRALSSILPTMPGTPFQTRKPRSP